ncbi:type II toxin-antitoxin system YafQ family toxin [bacterium]|nr:MAG: type II toxin-antitoxin system YafQ family toxin [bacterium]
MSRTPSFTGQFRRDVKLMKKRGREVSALETVLGLLIDGEQLPARYRDHSLSGNWIRHRECHIEPDWLLIYRIFEGDASICFERTGTHSDLFR